MSRVDNFIIREGGGTRFANSLVLGAGVRVENTAGGLPELTGLMGDSWLTPSGGDDTARIRAALAGAGVRRLRLAPGVFTIADRITLQPGQTLSGAGVEQTTVEGTDLFVEMLPGSTVEMLSLVGVHLAGGPPTEAGVQRVDRVRVSNAEVGIEGAGRWVVTGSSFHNVSGAAISIFQGRVSVSDVVIAGCGAGLDIHTTEATHLSGISIRDSGAAVSVNTSPTVSLNAVRVSNCGTGVHVVSSRGVSLAAVQVHASGSGIRLENCSGTVSGGSVMAHTATGAAAQSPLAILGCASVTVDGFFSDMTGAGAGSPPHLRVASGSVQVMVTSIHRVNGATAPATEVDVAAAGGRVLFGQQNFDPAKINSGGKYVAL